MRCQLFDISFGATRRYGKSAIWSQLEVLSCQIWHPYLTECASKDAKPPEFICELCFSPQNSFSHLETILGSTLCDNVFAGHLDLRMIRALQALRKIQDFPFSAKLHCPLLGFALNCMVWSKGKKVWCLKIGKAHERKSLSVSNFELAGTNLWRNVLEFWRILFTD